ncbi:MAG TPA: PKD domain-containing protein [Candidatus Pacearchaeota archaeon]|nr:PKD domain-containing protein [Candidatus Pacearchaeota archaeon]
MPYDSGKACGNDACSGAVEIYSTSIDNNEIILTKANIWNYPNVYYIIRACRSVYCTPWSYKTYAYTYYYPYSVKISTPYTKINSLPSPPNGIDILSPPIIFDWESVQGSPGYQYYIKNNKTGDRREYTTTSYSIVIPFENNVDSKDWFHQSDDRGYEWGIRFCTSGNLNDCGNANSSPWTTASNFSVQRNLIKDSIKIDTQTAKRTLNVPAYYNRITDPLNNRRWNDVFLNANLTSIFTSNPQLVDFDTEQESSGNDFTIPVGEKLRLKLNKPDIENSISWVIRGGAIDEPPAYWVDDAKKIYDNLTPLPNEYLYESTVNLGSLGTYYPKIGMAVSDPSKDWSKVEVKAFNASDCNNGDCSQAGESDTVKIEKDDNGYYITGQQEGIVYLQVKINDLDTVQTIDNKWFEMGKINSEMATFVITVDGQVPLAEAGDDKTTFSENFVSLDGSVLYQDSLQPSEQIVKLMVPNPKFDPSKPVSPTNQPEIEKDYKQITNYFYQYEWSCEKGSVENQNSLSATFKAPKIEEDTDVKCFLKMKVYKIIDMISVEDGSLAPEYPKPPELVQESTDSMIVKVLYNQKPVISDLSYDKPDSCNSGATVSIRLTWKYTDNDPAQKAYQIKILEPELDTGKIISESTSYLATGLEYGKTYTWELIAWDQNDVESNKESGTFTTPTHRYPSVDFSFLKIEDPENKDIIKYKFTSNVTTYDDPPKAVLKWNFGDGAESAEKDPEHTYSAAGDYIVKLEATDGDGNMCLMEKDLQAQSEEYIYSENPDIEMFNR